MPDHGRATARLRKLASARFCPARYLSTTRDRRSLHTGVAYCHVKGNNTSRRPLPAICRLASATRDRSRSRLHIGGARRQRRSLFNPGSYLSRPCRRRGARCSPQLRLRAFVSCTKAASMVASCMCFVLRCHAARVFIWGEMFRGAQTASIKITYQTRAPQTPL